MFPVRNGSSALFLSYAKTYKSVKGGNCTGLKSACFENILYLVVFNLEMPTQRAVC